ncbi:MAG: hypothetical protein ACJAZ2_002133 [Glaciecola sp.]|jgi:hypothetical protein
MKRVASILVISMLGFTSCEYDREDEKKAEEEIELTEETPVEISYLVDIRPIIETSCKTQLGPGSGCHDSWIDDYQAIKNSLNSGSWQTVVLDTRRMPISPNDFGIDSLSEAEIKIMTAWIEEGYNEN